MKINEICKRLGITKKAIVYYEKQGLLKIPKDDKGYRKFDVNHLNQLREITLYRRLSIATKEIKTILSSNSKSTIIRSIAREKELELKRMENKYSIINKMLKEEFDETTIEKFFDEVTEQAYNDESFVINKFKEVFPEGLGNMLSLHFSNFKFEAIINKVQKTALFDMIRFLDDLAPLNLPTDFQNLLMTVSGPEHGLIMSHVKTSVMSDISSESLELMKNTYDDVFSTIENEAKDIFNEMKIGKDIMTKFFSNPAYKENIVNNMMILSREYEGYQNALGNLGNSYKENL